MKQWTKEYEDEIRKRVDAHWNSRPFEREWQHIPNLVAVMRIEITTAFMEGARQAAELLGIDE